MKGPTTRSSRLGFALLGQLARGPRSGYELSRELEGALLHFWSARHSQIYPELRRLLDAGAVRVREVAQRSRPDKKIYRISAAGRAALRDWLLSPLPASPVRSELHLRAHSLWLLAPTAASRFYGEQAHHARDEAETFRAQLRGLEAEFGGPPPSDHERFPTYANLRFGHENRLQLARWCEWLARSLAS